jgi:hypothetical protein
MDPLADGEVAQQLPLMGLAGGGTGLGLTGPPQRTRQTQSTTVLLLLRDHHHDLAGGMRTHMSRRITQRDIEQPSLAVAADHQQVSPDF